MKTRAQALSRTESTSPRFSWRYDMSAPFQRVASRRPPFSLLTFLVLASSSIALHAQSPWERAALNLEATFTGPLARSLALVAIVIGGLMFFFCEGGGKRHIFRGGLGGGVGLFACPFLACAFF